LLLDKQEGKRQEGKVLEVIERAREEFIGVVKDRAPETALISNHFLREQAE